MSGHKIASRLPAIGFVVVRSGTMDTGHVFTDVRPVTGYNIAHDDEYALLYPNGMVADQMGGDIYRTLAEFEQYLEQETRGRAYLIDGGEVMTNAINNVVPFVRPGRDHRPDPDYVFKHPAIPIVLAGGSILQTVKKCETALKAAGVEISISGRSIVTHYVDSNYEVVEELARPACSTFSAASSSSSITKTGTATPSGSRPNPGSTRCRSWPTGSSGPSDRIQPRFKK